MKNKKISQQPDYLKATYTVEYDPDFAPTSDRPWVLLYCLPNTHFQYVYGCFHTEKKAIEEKENVIKKLWDKRRAARLGR